MRNLILLVFALTILISCGETPTKDNNTTNPPVVAKTPCEDSPADPLKVDWMKEIIEKQKIEEVYRYDLDEKPVYFFKVVRCCDFQSFLHDCSGQRVCVDGGITGGTCKGTMERLKNKKLLLTIELPAEDKKGKRTVEMPAEGKEATSQPK